MKRFVRSKKGYTLTEMLAVVAIIAVIAAIAIPSLLTARRNLEFKRLNEHAKEVYLAAQSNLAEKRAAGQLGQLQAERDRSGGTLIPVSPNADENAAFPEEDYSSQYCYAVTGSDAFNLILPIGSIESSLREQNILIEVNPKTANVYAVFYSEGDTELSYENVSREESARKGMHLGYYQGTGLSASDGWQDISDSLEDAQVEVVSEQEAFVRVTVPVPSDLLARPTAFMDELEVTAVVTGEQLGGSFTLTPEMFGYPELVDGNTVVYQARIDSLVDGGSFGGIRQNSTEGLNADRSISEIADAASMLIKPGENVLVEVSFVYDGMPQGDETKRSTVGNPLFQKMDVVNRGQDNESYDIYLANGRHLQNLNAVAPVIGERVGNVYFSDDIYWNETVGYYNAKYGNGGTYTNDAGASKNEDRKEVPGRALPNFLPITNGSMFGMARFAFKDKIVANIPLLKENSTRTNYAVVHGNGHKVAYLNIDTTKNIISLSKQYNILGIKFEIFDKFANLMGRNCYVTRLRDGSNFVYNDDFAQDSFTGLFSYANTQIMDLSVVNSAIKGGDVGIPTAGSLIGTAGYNTFLYNCSAYIDTEDTYFSRAAMGDYKVDGSGAVGGLVGYSKSHRTVLGILDYTKRDYLAFSNCFAAVPVSGNIVYWTEGARFDSNIKKLFTEQRGYVNGVGGLVGVSILTNYYNCYASGNVNVDGTWYAEAASTGANRGLFSGGGGFVGTAHGTMFTNCFATGNVNQTKAYGQDNRGGGGFAGVLVNNESFTYEQNSIFGRYYRGQFSQFNSCYCLGYVKAKDQSKPYYGFIGGYNSGTDLDGYTNLTFFNQGKRDYYSTDSKFKKGNYLYKDVYFWNPDKGTETDDNLTSNVKCGDRAAYSDLMDLPAYQTNRYNSDTKKYADARSGFSGWNKAKATHSYGMGTGTVYPFSMMQNLEFYGSWPPYMANEIMAYYEEYTDGSFGFYTNSDQTNTLRNDAAVKNDGYCLLIKNERANVTLKVGGKSFPITSSGKPQGLDVTDYYMYKIPAEVERAAESAPVSENGTAVQRFFSKLEANISNQNYTFYWNPRFAATQVNPVYSGSDTPNRTAQMPESLGMVYIRTARQLYALSLASQYWTKDFRFEQVLNVDAGTYGWNNHSIAKKPDLAPIGTTTNPFQASYNGGYEEKTAVRGFARVAEGGNWGLFGIVGKDGSVQNITVEASGIQNISGAANVGLAAAVNNGKLTGIRAVLGSTVSLNAENAKNVGLIAGTNTGTLSNCTVTGGNVTVTGENVGGMVGKSTGTENGSCTVQKLEGSGTKYLGGIVGRKESGTLVGEYTVGTVSGDGAVGGLFGFFSGELNGGKLRINEVHSNTGNAAGLIGEFADAQIRNYTLSLDSTGSITGKTGAAGVVGSGSKLTAVSVTVQLDGSVKSTAGDAAGFALNVQDTTSVINTVVVQIGGTVESVGGNASGLMNNVTASQVTGSRILLNSGKISAKGGNAAGFAQTVANIGECSVSGTGNITSDSGNAAGFAGTVNGEVNHGFVAAVRADSADLAAAYQSATNAGLKITAPAGEAAGFANTNKGTLFACYALGTVNGKNGSAGMVNTNTGSIRRSFANTTLTNGSGFVGTNSGNVEAAYAWYTGAASGFVGTNSGKISAAYAAPLSTDAKVLFGSEGGTYTDCYGVTSNEDSAPASGVDGIQNLTYDALALLDKADFASSTQWDIAADSSIVYKYFPYNSFLKNKQMPYPMLLQMDHYGDWKTAQVYPRGIFYYEYTDSANGRVYHLDVTEVTTFDDTGITLSVPDANKLGDNYVISGFGYGIFGRNLTEFNQYTNTLTGMPTICNVQNKLRFVSISENASSGNKTISVLDHSVNPYFAKAVYQTAPSEWLVRNTTQLRNINSFNSQNFRLDRNIDAAGVTAINTFSGSLNGAGHTLANVGTLVRTLNGTITDLTVHGGTAPFVMRVMQGASVTALTVNNYHGTSSLIGEVSGTVSNVTMSGANVTVNNFTGGNVGLVAGKLLKGSVLKNVTLKDSSLSVSVKNASNLVSVGGVAGYAEGANLEAIQVNGLTAVLNALPTETKAAAADYAFGGVLGRGREVSVNERTYVTNCTVGKSTTTAERLSTLTVNVEGENCQDAALHVGGLAGDCQAVVSGGVVTDTTVTSQQPEYETGKTYPSVTANIGGLTGKMQPNAVLTASHAGEQGKAVTINAPVSGNVGGAVGCDADKTNRPAKYGKAGGDDAVYAVTVLTTGGNAKAGQFIGYVVNGQFDACEGWGNTSLGFLGDIYSEDATVAQNSNWYRSDYSLNGATATRKDGESAATYTDKNSAATFNQMTESYSARKYFAALNRCYYQGNGQVYQQIVGEDTYFYNKGSDTRREEPYYVLKKLNGESLVSGGRYIFATDTNIMYTVNGKLSIGVLPSEIQNGNRFDPAVNASLVWNLNNNKLKNEGSQNYLRLTGTFEVTFEAGKNENNSLTIATKSGLYTIRCKGAFANYYAYITGGSVDADRNKNTQFTVYQVVEQKEAFQDAVMTLAHTTRNLDAVVSNEVRAPGSSASASGVVAPEVPPIGEIEEPVIIVPNPDPLDPDPTDPTDPSEGGEGTEGGDGGEGGGEEGGSGNTEPSETENNTETQQTE